MVGGSVFLLLTTLSFLYLISFVFRFRIKVGCPRDVQALVQTSDNNMFSSCLKIKTSQFVGPEGPRGDAFLR